MTASLPTRVSVSVRAWTIRGIFDIGNEDPGTTDEKSLHNLTQQTCFGSLSTTIGCGKPHPGQRTWNLVFFFNRKSKTQQCFVPTFWDGSGPKQTRFCNKRTRSNLPSRWKPSMWLSLQFAVDNQPKYMFIEENEGRRLFPHPISLQTD